MNKELKEKWIEALKSGEYNQGISQLRQRFGSSDTEFCCLGVLCEVATQIVEGFNFNRSEDAYKIYDHYVGWATLSDEALGAVGLPSSQQNELVHMNDFDHAQFNTIADWIEKNVKVVDEAELGE